jgi:hypothetical protein
LELWVIDKGLMVEPKDNLEVLVARVFARQDIAKMRIGFALLGEKFEVRGFSHIENLYSTGIQGRKETIQVCLGVFHRELIVLICFQGEGNKRFGFNAPSIQRLDIINLKIMLLESS